MHFMDYNKVRVGWVEIIFLKVRGRGKMIDMYIIYSFNNY